MMPCASQRIETRLLVYFLARATRNSGQMSS